MVVMVQLGSTEEVGYHVVHARAMLSSNGQVVAQGNAVQLTQQASECFTACCLSVDDMHVGAVVDVEQQRLPDQPRPVR